MKPTVRFPAGPRALPILLLGVISVLAAVSPARAQTGIYTLNGGSATQSSQTYAATAADQSGVYVLDSGEVTLNTPTITKTGDAASIINTNARGTNAGVLATSAADVTIVGGSVSTAADGAHGLFATGIASVIKMADGKITTSGSDSSGVDVTFGGAIFLNNVSVATQQNASPALAMAYGGGGITVTGGSFVTAGSLSPAILSLGTVAVTSAILTAHASSGATIDGANAIYLTGCTLTGLLDGVDLEQSAQSTGSAVCTVNGGSVIALAGDLVFMASQSGSLSADITLQGGVSVIAGSGNLVNATSNSTANFVADGETLTGNFVTDATSTIAAVLQNGATLTGAANAGAKGADTLSIDATSTWKVKGASVLSSLTNAGTVAFASDGLTVDVSGAYQQAATGKLVVVLGGTKAGANYDQLAIAGAATLAGKLEVNAAAGFTPKIGETFNIVTYGSAAGSFTTLTSNSGLTYTVTYGGREATITITSTSSSSRVPVITSQPASVKADAGASAAFSVAAAGLGPLTYRWYYDGNAIQGATNASYMIADVTAAKAGSYDVVITNSYGTVTSATATLQIRATTAVVPVVTIAVEGDGEIVEGGEKGKALISRTGDTSAALNVYYQLKGAAVNGSDYVGTDGAALPGEIAIPAGSASVKLKLVATSGTKGSAIEKVNVVLTTSPAGNYALGAAVKARLELIDQ